MDRRSKLPDPWKGRSSSNSDKRRIFFLIYEDELVPWRRPEIWGIQENGQQLKYVVKESTHTPGTLRAIPSGVLNRLAKLTSRNPSIQAEVVETICPAHANALRKAGLAPPIFPTIVDLWIKQDEKVDKEK